MDQQIELVTTFADQAAIAIENVRLFESVEARTRELAASLEDLRTTQDRLVQTQKLASLGQLTAGIASIRSQASSPKLRSSCRVLQRFSISPAHASHHPRSPLMAQSGHGVRHAECPLSAVKRTSCGRAAIAGSAKHQRI